MPEAVIVDAVRTPDRPRLQGLARPAAPRRDGRLRGGRPARAQPRGRPGAGRGGLLRRAACPRACRPSTSARIIALLSEQLPVGVNGATISRYCASSLESIRQAANAVVAGQGDAYIAAGVEWVSRYNEAVEGARPQDQNEHLQGKNGDPDAYISMGLTAENVAERYEVSRADMDKYAQRSQELAVSLTGERLLRPRDRAGHAARRHRGRQGRRPAGRARLSRSCPSSSPAFKEDGKVTAGNSCPLNDGAAAVLVMSDGQGERARPDGRARG